MDSKKPQLSIDWALSVQLANNKPEVAKELLTMFVESLPQFQQDINNALSQKNMQQLQYQVHKLHGGCYYVGAPILKILAAEIETKIKANDTATIDSDIAKLIAEINHIITEYKQQKFSE